MGVAKNVGASINSWAWDPNFATKSLLGDSQHLDPQNVSRPERLAPYPQCGWLQRPGTPPGLEVWDVWGIYGTSGRALRCTLPCLGQPASPSRMQVLGGCEC